MKALTSLPSLPNAVSLRHSLKSQPESYWIRRGRRAVLTLFQQMAAAVPAYKDFLKKNKVNPDQIKSIEDFKSIPTLDKQNYLRHYDRQDLMWSGQYKQRSWVIASTSGSTGEPYYFPRQNYQDEIYALIAELYLIENFHIDKRSTLYIIGFPMGAWIGGVFTYQALKIVANRGQYPLTIMTPGINKVEIVKAVKNLGQDFDQILIGSYGPFLKDIIDDAKSYGLNWKDYDLGFIFSAEAFSEKFRDYVISKTGLKDIYRGTLNHYGTVDLGTMSHETPLAILARRQALETPKLYKLLFGTTTKLPTLTQFLPELFYFEQESGNLICSSYSGIPLIRYDLKDHGGVFTLGSLQEKLTDSGLDFDKLTKEAGINNTIWNLPFVHVYERSDFSVSFFAFQIYPETIRKALLSKDIQKFLTGKFTMLVKYNQNADQYLEINVELKKDQTANPDLEHLVQTEIMKTLLNDNSEYHKTAEVYPDKIIPQIVFWPYENPAYFKAGGKQLWVKKDSQ